MTRNNNNRHDSVEYRARELCLQAGINPDSRVAKGDSPRGMPAWCGFRAAARESLLAESTPPAATPGTLLNPTPPRIVIRGTHESATLTQMRSCVQFGDAKAAAIMADGHLGYAQPVGAVIAYENQISISGVGFDQCCGNAAIRLDIPAEGIRPDLETIATDITKAISFGVGRSAGERADDSLFDDGSLWVDSGMESYRTKARSQLGSVGGGNHYVDVFEDEDGWVWVGCHFGSRGLGHTATTQFLKAAGGKDGINVPPCLVSADSALGQSYQRCLELTNRYAYAGRTWVCDRVRRIIGGRVTDSIHNNHNWAWKESHIIDGEEKTLWVVRKGATPAFPGQRGFVGGSMGDDAVILEGVDSEESRQNLYSTVHGAGRIMGRKDAKRTFTRGEMDSWIARRGVLVRGGDLDESPMAYRRLPDVLAAQGATIRVLHTLTPMIVIMAGPHDSDPWKD